jgi:hypothetical protein
LPSLHPLVVAAWGTLKTVPVSLTAVFRIGLTFPGVEESPYWASRALKIKGQMMACIPSHKSAEPNSLLIRVERGERAALLAEAPHLYYVPDHYLDYDAVLVRLAHCTPELAHDLLAMGYNFVLRKGNRKPSSVQSTGPSRSGKRSPRRLGN